MEASFTNKNISISRRELFILWQTCSNADAVYENLLVQFEAENITEHSAGTLKNTIKLVLSKFKIKWQEAGRYRNNFLQKNSIWLDGMFTFVCICQENILSASSSSNVTTVGRPVKNFEDCGARGKKNKIQDILTTRSLGEIVLAAEVATRQAGKRDAANIIKAIANAPSEVATKIKKLRMSDPVSRSFTNEEALAFFIDCRLTKYSYNLTRKRALDIGHNIYPSYYELSKAKKDCLLSEVGNDIIITENCVTIKVQSIVDLTAKRLVFAHSTVFENFPHGTKFIMICKWGCDGSSGHSTYKQKFQDCNANDEFLFAFSFVPLKLYQLNNEKLLAWNNQFPSSTRNCRPLTIMFAKETTELTKTETEKIQNQLASLLPTKVITGGKEIIIYYKFLLTMVDGKVCNALTGTKSSQSCYICGATPKLMNDNSLSPTNTTKNYEFGMSTLHAWIRSFECFLHISYRLNVKKWAITKHDDKEAVKNRKFEIQRKFKEELGLLIDRPKPGFGSTNDGNTARRFFKNFAVSARITGLSSELLEQFYVILSTLSSGYDINTDDYEIYVRETRALYLDLYSWYYMPATVHKILVHSTEIIRSSLVPIGMLSEEAQEARNKDLRRFRERNARKFSRIDTNKDLITILLLTSDPLINTFRKSPIKTRKSLPKGVVGLLKTPDVNISYVSEDDSDGSSDESI